MNTKKLLTQVKRELWENKIRFVYAPIVVTAIYLALMCFAVVKFSLSLGSGLMEANSSNTISIGSSSEGKVKFGTGWHDGTSVENRIDAKAMIDKMQTDGSNLYDMVVSGVTFANTSFLAILFLFVWLAYAHGCLFDDRKNKDILFWRSLPVSETSNVLVKLGFLLFYAPVVVFLLNIVVGFFALLGASIFFSYHGVALSQSLGSIADSSTLLIAPKIFFGSILSSILLLPVIGFILLSSAWAKKSPFLFSSVLPVGLIILDKISQKWFGFNLHVLDLLNAYWVMLVKSAQSFALERAPFGNLSMVFDAYFISAMLISIVIGAVLVTGAIWLRNNRYEI